MALEFKEQIIQSAGTIGARAARARVGHQQTPRESDGQIVQVSKS